jgi:hypothetical protein
MSQEDQRYAFAAAAAAAAYAQKKARDEARRALVISTALNQNMSSMDPKTQEDLQQLLQAEAQRVRQENWEWKAGLWLAGIVFGGFALFFLVLFGEHSCRSYEVAIEQQRQAVAAHSAYEASFSPQGKELRDRYGITGDNENVRWKHDGQWINGYLSRVGSDDFYLKRPNGNKLTKYKEAQLLDAIRTGEIEVYDWDANHT